MMMLSLLTINDDDVVVVVVSMLLHRLWLGLFASLVLFCLQGSLI